MGLADELYIKMLEVGYTARRHKIPELGDPMIETARKCLPIWRADGKTLVTFCRRVLRIPNLRMLTSGQLPEPVGDACWRLVDLLEYLADETEIN